MENKKNDFSRDNELRMRAEELLKFQFGKHDENVVDEKTKILHELQVHQIELEMQNEELRTMQVKLEDARHKYFDFYNLALVGYIQISESDVIDEVNTTTLHLFGVTRNQILQQPITMFVHRDDRDIYYLHRKRLLETNSLQRSDLRMINSDGTTFWAQLDSILSQRIDGQSIHLMTISDISERKQHENHLLESIQLWNSTFDAIQDSMFILDTDGIILFANKISLSIFNKTENEIVGHHCYEVVHNSDCSIENCPFIKAKESKQSETVTMLENEQWSDISVHPLFDTEHHITGAIHIIRNVTERRNSDQIIRDVQRREGIGVLAGGIAHDFNNLLSAMMGNVSLAQNLISVEHPASKNLIRTMTAIKRAATLTKQLLAYSGKGRFQLLIIDLGKVVFDNISIFEVALPKNVRLTIQHIADPIYVLGDPGQIEQIVMNLILNGGEAIGLNQGEVSVEVSKGTLNDEELHPYQTITSTKLEKGEYAFLTVTDTGCGMSEDIRVKIFDPFFTTKFVGRGLGLSAVLGIIRGHRGGISIESKEGFGTTFRVILPLANAPQSTNVHTGDHTLPSSIKQLSILVIDDEQEVINTVADILENGNYLPIVKMNPLEGIHIYETLQQVISLIILDLTMPLMNGEEVLVRLQTIDPTVKVILSSGYSEEEAKRRLGGVLPTAFIQKPYSAVELLSLVNEILKKK